MPPFTVQHYLIVWTFPTVEGAWESCPGFADYINSGAPGDAFDGFALKYRVCEPISGSGVAIAVASDIGKVWAHLGPWIKDFGICLLYTSPSPRDISGSRMPSSA